MSDKQVKEERSKAKDKRQQPAPSTIPKRKPGKKHKPIVVEARFVEEKFTNFFGFSRDWFKFGKYRNTEEAETAIKNDKRKWDFYEYRIRP